MGPDKLALDSKLDEATSRELEPEYRERATDQSESLRTRLGEERRRRKSLERRLNELSEENRRGRQQAEQSERFSQIRSRLQELGVKKVDLAFRLVKEDIYRGEDGDLYADADGAQVAYKDYLTRFVSENPEFLPPRISGGSGATGADRGSISSAGFDLDRIRPGMSQEELAQAWKEVARLAGRGSTGW